MVDLGFRVDEGSKILYDTMWVNLNVRPVRCTSWEFCQQCIDFLALWRHDDHGESTLGYQHVDIHDKRTR